METEHRNEDVNLGSLLVETGATVASLILFPAISQSLRISPVVTKAIKMALQSR